MAQEIITSEEEQMITDKGFREQFMDRLDVLDRVKQLLLIPQMDCMTIRQVAEFYEVSTEVIKWQFKNNLDEFTSDGSMIKFPKDFKIFKGS